MLATLKNHPFAVEAYFERSLVLTFAVPKEQLLPLIPPCLSPDSFGDRWGFLAVALVQTRALRPKGFPAGMGRDFFLAGFRVFVQYRHSTGRRLRGLYILRSETDSRLMSFWGNVFTHYQYRTTDVSVEAGQDSFRVQSGNSGFDIQTGRRGEDIALPAHSPFSNWKEARRFAGPLPFTFTYDDKRSQVLIIEGVRSHWEPRPVEVLSWRVGFLESLALDGLVLANAFEVCDVPYYWKKGVLDPWRT